MTILLSALTRYHVFDLALQLQKRELIEGLVTAYPHSKLGPYAALRSKVISRPHFALARKAALLFEGAVGPRLASSFNKHLYQAWSLAFTRVAKSSPASAIYGLSGYMLETLLLGAGAGRPMIVDHGSLHIETERRILREECARYGFVEFGNWQHDWLLQRMRQEFALADHVVCCSELARQTMIENGVPAAKVTVQRLGVSLNEFSRTSSARRRSNACPLRLVFVGAMTPLKGLHYLLKAFLTLPVNTELWLIGTLPTDPILQQMVAECMRSTKRVKLIGPVAQSQLKAIYSQCDLFVLPSMCDGWGMVVSQALACGLPVVVSDMTGAKELVLDGENGYIFKSGDINDLVEKLEFSLSRCLEGAWRDGTNEEVTQIREHTWDHYGEAWTKWLRTIAI